MLPEINSLHLRKKKRRKKKKAMTTRTMMMMMMVTTTYQARSRYKGRNGWWKGRSVPLKGCCLLVA